MANSEAKIWPVGLKLPNACGAFDMHGSLSEVVSSIKSGDKMIKIPAPLREQLTREQLAQMQKALREKMLRDKRNTDLEVNSADHRFVRGGSFNNPPHLVRSATSGQHKAGVSNSNVGFRLARTISR